MCLLGAVIAAGCATADLPLSGPLAGGAAAGTAAGTVGGSSAAPGGAGMSNGGALAAGTANGGPAYLPVRVRRLTDDEWRASAFALFGVNSMTAATFTPDSTQTGFAVNDGQQVDPVLAGQIDTAAHEIAAGAVALSSTAPCADPTNGGEACAKSFIATLVPQAYRRPAVQAELDGLLVVYHAAADGGAYTDGIQAVIAAVLDSPGFIYVTEMGSATGDTVNMTDFEIASELSYLLTGNPPDSTLTSAAQAGQLQSAANRQSQAGRLLKTTNAQTQLTKVIEQWLGIDSVAQIAKDTTVYPNFANLAPAMKAEADAYISEIVWNEGKGVAELFGANWTIASASLASFYGAPAADATGRVSLAGTGRTGILDQGAFLSVYAHASESGPVLRGVAILRNVACVTIPDPSSLNIVVVPPTPDPTKTTRQRYAVHATDPVCASCHTQIDSVGFAFENFDGEGQLRTTDATPPQPVDSTTTVATSTADLGNSYADSAALGAAIANSAAVRQCFARKMFQYAAARNDSDTTVKAAEDAFVSTWNALPQVSQNSLIEVLVAYAGSPAFITRKVVP
jgi:uncharacterized protein DUF1592/uncharacterized protein DUF1588/uncharacterized protein DUF1595/uncharacterized protein DUF1587